VCELSYKHCGFGPFQRPFQRSSRFSLGKLVPRNTVLDPDWASIVTLHNALWHKLLVDGSEGGTFRPLHIFSSHAKKYAGPAALHRICNIASARTPVR
jgi:hypothetical protein